MCRNQVLFSGSAPPHVIDPVGESVFIEARVDLLQRLTHMFDIDLPLYVLRPRDESIRLIKRVQLGRSGFRQRRRYYLEVFLRQHLLSSPSLVVCLPNAP